MMQKISSFLPAVVFFLLLSVVGCSSTTKIEPVQSVDPEKYVGTWYEIARLDFSFERNLEQTTAEYQLMKNGTIKVTNRGFNYKTKQWKKAEGKARFRSDKTNGALEVSFFGPFYGEYNIIALDTEYKYVLVAGKNTNFLWILSRTKTIPDTIKTEYLRIALETGYDTKKLIWVKQSE